MSDLSALLSPRSIAILGASSDFRKINGRPLKHLLDKGYAGKIYPVNPKYSKLGALVCYPSISALPEPVDLAIVAVPARLVAAALCDLGKNGAKAAIVFSSGFGETGPAGRALEQQVIAAAHRAGLRLCGPNCLGLINAFERVIATFGQFADGETPPGPVGFVTQSGAFGTAIAALARRRALGLGYFVNTGNEGDVTFAQVMRGVLADPRIGVGAGYIEGLKDGAGLIELAEAALAAGKPLVLVKVGRSKAGARAAASHTGSLAGADAVFDGVMRQYGIVRARNEEHMLDMVEAFACCGLPLGNGLGIITQSGGAGVLMADRAEELGLSVPVLSKVTQLALQEVIPEFGACGNPVDITGQFIAEPALLRESVKLVLSDPQVHVGIVWLQLMDGYVDPLITIFEEIKSRVGKPFIVCWVAAPEKALHELRARGIAVLRGAEPAVDAAAALVRYAELRRQWQTDGLAPSALTPDRLNLPSASISSAAMAEDYPPVRRTKGGIMPTLCAAKLLTAAGVALARVELARSPDEAEACAERLGYPVALKIESPAIPHKTEAKGVMLGLRDAAAVKAAFADVIANAGRYRPDAAIEGVIVQAMAPGWAELVVGLKHDPVFGMVIMVGLGGIHVEVLRDVAFRKAPVTVMQAERMLGDLKSRAILDGVRGYPAVDRAALTRLISAVSLFGAAAGERLQELDLNPVLAGPAGATAVDWLMVCNTLH